MKTTNQSQALRFSNWSVATSRCSAEVVVRGLRQGFPWRRRRAKGKVQPLASQVHGTLRRRVQPVRGWGFTLIELLVVIAIIAILASLLLPGNRVTGWE